ncbi:MAG: YggS family pyridoxal phosphate-dependent enzyme [Bacteroidota bacterium]
MSIADNIASIQQRISAAEKKSGRVPGSVKLIAVSKTKPLAMVQEAFVAGHIDFGENRDREMRDKHKELAEVNWHMIGNFQRSNIKYFISFVYLIHSISSEKLLRAVNKEAEKHQRVVDCLLQLHISGESAKSGLEPSEAEDLLRAIESFPNIRIKGLMGMAALSHDEKLIQSQFRSLRLAKEAFQAIQHPRIQLEELSMGMSGDYHLAIQEGATMIRIGSAIFGSRG